MLPHQLRDKVGSLVILAPQLHCPLKKDALCGAEEEIDQVIMQHGVLAIREQGGTLFYGSLAQGDQATANLLDRAVQQCSV